jgi:hypothetical protein
LVSQATGAYGPCEHQPWSPLLSPANDTRSCAVYLVALFVPFARPRFGSNSDDEKSSSSHSRTSTSACNNVMPQTQLSLCRSSHLRLLLFHATLYPLTLLQAIWFLLLVTLLPCLCCVGIIVRLRDLSCTTAEPAACSSCPLQWRQTGD